jgi:hypothetical protein
MKIEIYFLSNIIYCMYFYIKYKYTKNILEITVKSVAFLGLLSAFEYGTVTLIRLDTVHS